MSLGSVSATLASVKDIYLSSFPGYSFDYTFLDDQIANEYQAENRLLTLSRIFSFLTLFIGSLGLYGLISFFVWQRLREIGIRKVLGSSDLGIVHLNASA